MEKLCEDQDIPIEPVNDSEAQISDGLKNDTTSCVSPKKIQLGIVQSSSGSRSCMGNLIKKSRWDQGPETEGEEIQESIEKVEDKSNVKSLIQKFEDIGGNSNILTDINEDKGDSCKPVDTPTPSRVKLVRTNFMKTDKPALACNSDDLKTDNLETVVKSNCAEVKPVAASKALQIISSCYDSPTDDSSQEGDIQTSENNSVVDNDQTFSRLDKDDIKDSSLSGVQQKETDVGSSTSTEKIEIIDRDIELADKEIDIKCIEVNDPVLCDSDEIKVSELIGENSNEETKIKNDELNTLCAKVSSNVLDGDEQTDIVKTNAEIIQNTTLKDKNASDAPNLEVSNNEVSIMGMEHPIDVQENVDILDNVEDNVIGHSVEREDATNAEENVDTLNDQDTFIVDSIEETPATDVLDNNMDKNIAIETNDGSLNSLNKEDPSANTSDFIKDDFIIVSHSDVGEFCDTEVEYVEETFSNQECIEVETAHIQNSPNISHHESIQEDNSDTLAQTKSDETKLAENDLNTSCLPTTKEAILTNKTKSENAFSKPNITYNDSVDETMAKMFSENSDSLVSQSLAFVDNDNSAPSSITPSQNEKLSTEIAAKENSQYQPSNIIIATKDVEETSDSLLTILETGSSIGSMGYKKETSTNNQAVQQEETENSTQTLNAGSATDIKCSKVLDNANVKNAIFTNKTSSELSKSSTEDTPDDSAHSDVILSLNEELLTKTAAEKCSQNKSANTAILGKESGETNESLLEILETDQAIATTSDEKETPTVSTAVQKEEMISRSQILVVDYAADKNTIELLAQAEIKNGSNTSAIFSNQTTSDLMISSTKVITDDSTSSTATSQNEQLIIEIAEEKNSQNKSANNAKLAKKSGDSNENVLEIVETDHSTCSAVQKEELISTEQTLIIECEVDKNNAELLEETEVNNASNTIDISSNETSSELLTSNIEIISENSTLSVITLTQNEDLSTDIDGKSNQKKSTNTSEPATEGREANETVLDSDNLTANVIYENESCTTSLTVQKEELASSTQTLIVESATDENTTDIFENVEVINDSHLFVGNSNNKSSDHLVSNSESISDMCTDVVKAEDSSSNRLIDDFSTSTGETNEQNKSNECKDVELEFTQPVEKEDNSLKTIQIINEPVHQALQEDVELTCSPSESSVIDTERLQDAPAIKSKFNDPKIDETSISTNLVCISQVVNSCSEDNQKQSPIEEDESEKKDLNKLMVQDTGSSSNLPITKEKEVTEFVIGMDQEEYSDVDSSEIFNIKQSCTVKQNTLQSVEEITEGSAKSTVGEPDNDTKSDEPITITHEQENQFVVTVEEDQPFEHSEYQTILDPNERKKNDQIEELGEQDVEQGNDDKIIESITNVASLNIKENALPTEKVETDSSVNEVDTTEIEQSVSFVDDASANVENTVNRINKQSIVGVEMKTEIVKQDKSTKSEDDNAKLIEKCEESEILKMNVADKQSNYIVDSLNDVLLPATDFEIDSEVIETISMNDNSSNEHSQSSTKVDHSTSFTTKTESLESVSVIDQPSQKHLEEYTVDNLEKSADTSKMTETDIDSKLKCENADIITTQVEKDILSYVIEDKPHCSVLKNPDNSKQQSHVGPTELKEIEHKSDIKLILSPSNSPKSQLCNNDPVVIIDTSKNIEEDFKGENIYSQPEECDNVVCVESEAETIEAIDCFLKSNQVETKLIKSNDASLIEKRDDLPTTQTQTTHTTVIESERSGEEDSVTGKLKCEQDLMITAKKSPVMILEDQSHAEEEDKVLGTSDVKLESISQKTPDSNKETCDNIDQTDQLAIAEDISLKIEEQLEPVKDDTVNVVMVLKGENSSKIEEDEITCIKPEQVIKNIELENTKFDIQMDSKKIDTHLLQTEIMIDDGSLTKKRPAPVSDATVHSEAKDNVNISEMPQKRLKISSDLSDTEEITKNQSDAKEITRLENDKQVKIDSVIEEVCLTKADSSSQNTSEYAIPPKSESEVNLEKDYELIEKDSIGEEENVESKTNLIESGQSVKHVESESTEKSLLTIVSNESVKSLKPVPSKEVPAPVRVSARQKQRQAAAAALAAEKAKLLPEGLSKKGSSQDKNLDKRGKKASVSPTKELTIKISTGKLVDSGKQSPLIGQKPPRTPELKSPVQTLPKKTPKELSQDKLEPITLKLSKEDNPVIIRSSSLSPKKIPSPASPQKTLGYTLKIGKDSTTIIPKDPTHSPKVRDSSPQSTSVKSDMSGNVGYLIKDTGLTITPIAVESQDQKLNKITLKLSKAGGHPEIKQEKSETWKAIKKLGEIDIVPVEGKASDSSGAIEKIDKVSPDKKFKVGEVTVEPSTSSSMSKLQGLLTQAPLNQSEDSEDVQFVGFGSPSTEQIQTEQKVSYDIGVVKQEPDLHVTPRRRGRPRKITTPDIVHSLPPGVTAKDILAASLQRQTLQQHLQQMQKPLQMPETLQVPVQEQESSQTMFPVPLFDLSEDTYMDPNPPTVFPDQVGLQPDVILRSARGRPIGRSRRPRGSGPVRSERGGPRGRPRGSRGIKRMLEEMEALSYPDMDEPITLDNIDSQIGPRVSEQSGSQITEKTMALLRKSIEGKKENLEKKLKRSDEEGNRDLDAEVKEMKDKIEAAYKAELKSPGKGSPEKEFKSKTPDKSEGKGSCKKEPPELIPIQTSIEKGIGEKHNFHEVAKESLKRKLSGEFSADEMSKRKSLEEGIAISDSIISLDISCDDMDVDQPASPEDPDQIEEVKADPDPPPKPVKPRPKSKAEIKRIKREKDRIRREAKKLAALEALKAPPPNPNEEDTRMSASDPNDVGDDGNGIKKSRLEVGDTEAKEFTVEQIAEYQWPLQGGELYMIQEQVSTYLGVKSFKRKYPDLKRRPVEMEERTFLCDSGLVSEAMCDLGLTAVCSSEVLDIMFQDFQDKYEELRKYMREKQARELINKQKERKKFEQSLSKSDLKEQAIQSSLSWNQALNRNRNESRRCHLDLQTWTVQYPRSRALKMTRPTPKLGNYPLALIPGQYSDYYKRYTPQELRYWPVNTVLYGPLQPNERNSTGGSDGSQSESEDTSSSDESSESSSEGEGTEEEEREKECKACGGGKRGGEMVRCAQCGHNIHVMCADLNPGMLVHVRKYSWQCSDCKTCQRCNNAKNESKMLFCDVCDRGYHSYCVGLRKVPSGSWSCKLCAAVE